jgi:sugar fermentation stimulation protein A
MKVKHIPLDFQKNLKESLNLNKLHLAYFIERPNRFIVHCEDTLGTFIKAHLPNPGRLQELFFPKVKLYLSKAADEVKATKVPRRTAYTVVAVERDGRPIFLHTHHSNTLVELLLKNSLIDSLKDYSIIKREAKYGHSRFDFLLQRTSLRSNKENDDLWSACKGTIESNDYSGKGLLWLEVKSCTLFGNNVAMFPDAITERGRRHLLELARLSDQGVDCAVLFAIHSPHIKYFMPDFHTDLEFSKTLIGLKDKLKIIPLSIPWTKDMSINVPPKEIPIPWNYLKQEVCDEGSYVLLAYFGKDQTLTGSHMNLEIKKGWHVYTGYSKKDLSKTIRGYKNKQRKTLLTKADMLAKHADKLKILPFISPNKDNCRINQDVQKLSEEKKEGHKDKEFQNTNNPLQTEPRNKQSVPLTNENNCSCADHYTFFEEDPLDLREFHIIIEQYRMKHPY